MLKSMHRVYDEYEGEKYTLNALYQADRKKRGKAKILASVIVSLGTLSLKESSKQALADQFLHKAVRFTTDRLAARRLESTAQLGEWEGWRERGQAIRRHTIHYLDYYLDQRYTLQDGSRLRWLTKGSGPLRGWLLHRRLPYTAALAFREQWPALKASLHHTAWKQGDDSDDK